MKQIINHVLSYIREDRNWRFYLVAMLFISLCIFFNYYYFPLFHHKGITIERYIVQNYYATRSSLTPLLYFLFYAFPYFVMVAIYYCFNKKTSVFITNPSFWYRSLFALVIMSFNTTTYLYTDLSQGIANPANQYFVKKTIAPLMPYLYLGIPLFFFWYWKDYRGLGMKNFYGLTFTGFHWRPYALMLLLMLPLLVWASFQPSFTSFYPTLKIARLDGFSLMPQWLGFIVYEIIYGGYFVWAEVLMRGFLVVGMTAIMGRAAIMPMVALYAFCHFDKPLGETISSVFGGYLLGIIALRTQNIMGGFWVHAGIAILMDVLAFGQWQWK